ncbi:hypothetical protein EUX98_g958 [Antrodiella citrinella]|uniref:MI domain-containing protein n=1 Tax=Antrodiella citrinella TaxID=2447956 RepID=A0A4S4N5J4_9APHY|nr:hypothetical protein EUX98_g958 [Antrodiella citrinella]
MSLQRHTGPSLPQTLLDEINGAGSSSGKSANANISRRDVRKQQRTEKKQSKAQFFSAGHNNPKRRVEQEHDASPQRKKQKLSADPGVRVASKTSHPEKDAKRSTSAVSSSKAVSKSKAKTTAAEPTALAKLAARADAGNDYFASPNKRARTLDEMAEDAYIARLESKLGKKGSKMSKEWEEDGLDDLMKDLDNLEASLFTTGLEEDAESDDAEDEGAGEWHGFGDATKKGSDTEYSSEALELVDVAGPASGTRYIPPHLRNRQPDTVEESEAQTKLKRQLKGLLNRMSEQNIASIVEGIEEIYRNHRRNDVTSTITTLLVEGISAHSILLDSYVVLHAALISSLHKLIGVEFAAYFVQNVVASYEKHYAAFESFVLPAETNSSGLGTEDVKGKETSNLIVLLSELYNFQVISCLLVYDIIRGLLEGELTEFKVELLLKITRNSGQQLRSDDPTTLKNIIQIVHSKLPEQQDGLSSRTRFMIETLSNLKNNRVKKAAAGQYAGGEAVDRMKKFLSGLTKKRQVRAHEPLRVTLSDLHSADTKGKWWLVGAAWGGNPLVDHKENTANAKDLDGPSEDVLMKLARKQGMNTDIRRNIFVVLMSSADYVEACERLSLLRLTETQQREFIRVILHCCGNEKQFNPYYTLVGQQLCRQSKSHQFTLQYCLWDLLRDLGETTVGGAEILKNMKDDGGGFDVKRISETRMGNVARAFGWWIAKDCCSLAILKPVDFTILQTQSRNFLTQLVTYTILATQLSTPLLSLDPKDHPDTHNRGPLEEVFIKATHIPVLALGLVYFIGEMNHADTGESSGFLKWARKVALDTLKTGMDVVPNL